MFFTRKNAVFMRLLAFRKRLYNVKRKEMKFAMKSRFKLLRHELRLIQEEFGSKIGVARNTIVQYESRRIIPSNSVIANICNEYAVNETWLRTGEGDMFKDLTPSEEIESFLSTLAIAGDENFKKRLILYLAQVNYPPPKGSGLVTAQS